MYVHFSASACSNHGVTMAHDPRDEIWNATFQTYYDAYYNEILAERLITRWLLIDQISKVLIAVTASGSAVSGWALWNNPTWQLYWVLLSGVAAILSIVHAAMGVTDRLKDAGEVRRECATLRIDIETFRSRMRINPEYPVDEFTEEYVGYHKSFGDCLQHLKDDVLRTEGLKIRVQDQVDDMLVDQISHDEKETHA